MGQPPKTTQEEYDRAEQKALEVLWQWVADRELDPDLEPVTYGGLSGVIGMYHFAGNFWNVLDDIDRHIDAREGPMITALVVDRYGHPGKKFFTLARKLGHKFRNKNKFWERQRDASISWIGEHPDYLSNRG